MSKKDGINWATFGFETFGSLEQWRIGEEGVGGNWGLAPWAQTLGAHL